MPLNKIIYVSVQSTRIKQQSATYLLIVVPVTPNAHGHRKASLNQLTRLSTVVAAAAAAAATRQWRLYLKAVAIKINFIN